MVFYSQLLLYTPHLWMVQNFTIYTYYKAQIAEEFLGTINTIDEKMFVRVLHNTASHIGIIKL